MVLQVLLLAAGACLFGLVVSVVVYRASNVSPVRSMVVAVIVVLALTAAAFAIFVFATNRAFPN